MLKESIKESFKNIQKEKGIFFSSLISLILVFTLINIFVFGILNLNDIKEERKSANQVILYLKTLNNEEKNNLQVKLLQTEGVSSLRYESKEIALKATEKELGIEVAEDENPLNDAFFVYVSDNVDINRLEQSLKDMKEISEIDLRAKAIETSLSLNKGITQVTYIAGISLFLFGSILIYNLSSLAVKSRRHEIYLKVKKNVDKNRIKTSYLIEGIITILLASVISYVIHYFIRGYIIDSVGVFNSSYIIPSTEAFETLVSFLVFILSVIVSIITNFLILNKYYNIKDKTDTIKEVEKEIRNLDKED